MTDLKRLYDAIDGRTKGPTPLHRERNHTRFVSVVGTCADEIASVLKTVIKMYDDGFIDKYNPESKPTYDALAALAAKVKGIRQAR